MKNLEEGNIFSNLLRGLVRYGAGPGGGFARQAFLHPGTAKRSRRRQVVGQSRSRRARRVALVTSF